MKITQEATWDPVKKGLGKVRLEIYVPPDFPDRYKDALIQTANLCTVKKTIQDPPEFEIEVITK